MASDDEGGGRGGLGSKRHAMGHDDSDDDLGGVGRKKRRGQDDENLFGIFARFDNAGEKKKKGAGKADKNFAAPMNFVKGTTMLQPTSIPEDEDGESKSDGEDKIDRRFVLDANAPNAQGLPAPVAGPKLPSKNKLSFNQMESNYGKGFAMMQKMGFTGGGIGRHNDGIANPIEVNVRQGKMGLQDEGEKVGQDLYGTDHIPGAKHTIEELLSVGMKKKTDDGPKMSESWKRDNKEKKPKVVYKTAAELAGEAGGMRIVDMRGPEVRVATSFTELQNLAGDGVRSLKELRHNTRLLVSRYEDKIRSAGERKRHFENILLSVAKEQERLQETSDMSDADVKSCKELVLEIDDLRDRQDRGLISLRELADAFRILRSTRPKEFEVLRAMDAAFSLALPAAKRELSTWRPLQRPEEGLLSMKPWKELAESAPVRNGSKQQGDAIDQLSILLEAALLPRLRHALSAWAPRDPEPCLRLMEQCRATLPSAAAEVITAEVVLPRLRAEIEAWDPRVDQVSAHLWLHPWLPFLGKRMDVLWPPVRFKISACLDRWDPADRSAHGFLKPWEKVFNAANWDPLIEKVLVRLERSLADTPVQPDGQDLQPMKDFVFWLDLAPLDGLARVLESAFFPQWHAVLQKWLRSSSCNFSEVLQWYQGWKAFFPAELKEHAPIQRQLAHGLEVMKHIMANGKSTELPEGPQAVPDSADTKRRPPPSVKAPVEEVTLSLSDYIAEVAAEEGLVFLPKKIQRNGKQVYQLGAATIQLDKHLVFAAPKSGDGDWKAVSMDEVLALARASPAKKKS